MTAPVAGASDQDPAPEWIARGLRQVCRRAAGLPKGDRRRAMELYLAFQLKEEGRTQVSPRLQEILEQIAPRRLRRGSQPRAAAGAPAESPQGAPPAASEAATRLEALGGLIRSLAGRDADPALEPEALLEQVRARAEAVERSVKDTAQEFFDRLLQALDPDAARAFVGKPGLRPAPIYKAAVFDAYAEKFSQLAEYHQKGRLVRDFRASFKRNLRG